MRFKTRVLPFALSVGALAGASARATTPLQAKRDEVTNLLASGVEDGRLKNALEGFLAIVDVDNDLHVREVDTLVRQLTQYDIPESIRPALLEYQATLTIKVMSQKKPSLLLITTLSDVVSLRNTYDVMAGTESAGSELGAMSATSNCLSALVKKGAIQPGDKAQTQLVWSALTLLARPDVKKDEATASRLLKILKENASAYEKVASKGAPPEFYRGAMVRASDQSLTSATEQILRALISSGGKALGSSVASTLETLFSSRKPSCEGDVSALDRTYHTPPAKPTTGVTKKSSSDSGKGYSGGGSTRKRGGGKGY